MVAQLTEHWGTRYTPHGKIIWAELAFPTPVHALTPQRAEASDAVPLPSA